MVEPELGPTFLVTCEECNIQKAVPSRVLAQDIVDGHEEETGCPDAEWREVDGPDEDATAYEVTDDD